MAIVYVNCNQCDRDYSLPPSEIIVMGVSYGFHCRTCGADVRKIESSRVIEMLLHVGATQRQALSNGERRTFMRELYGDGFDAELAALIGGAS